MGRNDRYIDKTTNETFIPINCESLGYAFRSGKDADHKIYLTHAEIYAALDSGKAEIDYKRNSVPMQKLRAIFGDETFEDRPPKDQAIALWREKLLQLFDADCEALGKRPPFTEQALKPFFIKYRKQIANEALDLQDDGVEEGEEGEEHKRGRADQAQTVTVFKRPSAKAVKRWHDDYYGSEMDVMALLPRHHGPGPKLYTIQPQAIAFAHKEACAYLDRTRPTKAKVYRDYIAALQAHNKPLPAHRQLDKVSRKKFEAMIGKFNAYDVVAARHGEKYAIKKFMAIARSFHVLAPGQRIEMDFVSVDLMSLLVETGIWNALTPEIQELIPRKRIYFGAAIDVATRYILAFNASLNPNGASAVATIRMIMTDKQYLSTHVAAQTPWVGKIRPWTIYHDSGSEFIAKQTQDVLRRARIHATRPPAGEPSCRPFIERLFHTIGLLIAPYFDGRTFHNVVAKADYDPQLHASLLVDELIKIFIFALCDIYHNRPHEGLGGRTPHNAWVAACQDYQIDYPPARGEMLHIFGFKDTRRISDYGVTFMGISYDDEELQRMRYKHGNVEVEIKFDPECVEQIAFKSDEGWLLARNTVGIDESVTLQEWIAARNELRAHYATEAEQSLKVMYEAINKLRETGVAATLRAGLSPRIPTGADFLKWESDLFSRWNVLPAENVPPLHQEGQFAYDPLHIGKVDDKAELFAKDRMEKAKDVEVEQNDTAAASSTSNFSVYNEDY